MAAIPAVTTTTVAQWLPTIFSAETLDARSNNTVLGNLIDQHFEKELTVGAVLKVPALAAMTALVKSADTIVTYAAATEGAGQSITVNAHIYVAFLVEDIAKLQSKYDPASKYSKAAGKALAVYYDGTGIAPMFAAFTQTVGTDNVDVTEDNILSGRTYLDTANVPDDDRFFVFSELQEPAFFKVDTFVNSQYRGDKGPAAIDQAKFGHIYGMDWIKSTNLYLTGSGHDNAIFHREAIASIVQQQPRVLTQMKIEYIATAVVTDMIYGLKEMRDTSGVWVKGK